MKLKIFLLCFLVSVCGFCDQPKIYDCFLFSNELEILEIRFMELYPYVHKFVLVESNETHRIGEPKPFYFEENKQRFARFLNKIIHIKLYEHIEGGDGWSREWWQRNQIIRGLRNCGPDDIIMISDVDEIPPASAVMQLPQELNKHRRIVFVERMYRWFLNRWSGENWAGTGVVAFKDLVELTPQEVRHLARGCHMAQWWAGWHFTSMGGYEKNKEKYRSIVEGTDTFMDEVSWRSQVNCHILVPIDDSYPLFIQKNIPYLIDTNLIDVDSTQK